MISLYHFFLFRTLLIREQIIIKDSVFNQEKSKELGKLEATHEIELA